MSNLPNFPTIRPSLLLDFANSKQVDPRISFTRTSTATYFDANGVLRSAASGVPRIDHDPVTGDCKGLLIEEQRTNLLLHSAADVAVGWSIGPNIQKVGNVLAPDGTLTATTYKALAAGNAFSTQIVNLQANTTYTASVYARLRSGSKPTAGTLISVDADKDGNNGTLERDMLPFSGLTIDSTFRRYSLTFQNVAPTTGYIHLCTDFNMGVEIDIWGAQLEIGTFPTSYIPTTSAAATRAADAASMTGTNFSECYRQDEGTFVVDAIVGLDLVSSVIISANSSVTNNAIEIFSASAAGTGPYGNVNTGGLNVASMTDGFVVANTAYRAAIAYRENNFAFSRDGRVAVTNSVGTVPAVTQLDIGARPALASMFNGHIKRIAYYPVKFSSSQLQALTA